MAMKTTAGKNLAQAYSSGNWEYTDYDAAYAGFAGGSVYSACVIRFDIPAFMGVSEALEISLVCSIGQGAEATLRWALCTSDESKALYAGTTAEVADSNQIATGTAVFQDMSSAVVSRSFRIPSTRIKGGTYYLFLWASNDTGINIRAVSSDWGSHSISLGYNIGIVRLMVNGQPRKYRVVVKIGGVLKPMIPYIKTPSGLRPGS